MQGRNLVPVWALLLSLPVLLFAINCGPMNPNDEMPPTTEVVKSGDIQQAADLNVSAKMATDTSGLALDEGGTDEWWRGRGFGRFGRGFGWGGFYGGYWPYFGYAYPYVYPYYGLLW